MSTTAIVIGIVIAVIAVTAAAVLILRKRRSQRLRTRFGPEYLRALEETGSRTTAEAKLEKLEKKGRAFRHKAALPGQPCEFRGYLAKDPSPIR
jgi:hypothetical protein